MKVAHSEALNVLANTAGPVLLIIAVIVIVSLATRKRDPRADDARDHKQGGKR